jgi:hypothetical protein
LYNRAMDKDAFKTVDIAILMGLKVLELMKEI